MNSFELFVDIYQYSIFLVFYSILTFCVKQQTPDRHKLEKC